MRYLILVLFLLVPSLSRAQTDQDDGLLWVALSFVDALKAGNPELTHDWVIPCSEQTDSGTLPHGFSLEQADRNLPDGMCEHTVKVRIGGWINDEFVFRRTILWKPGLGGHNRIGIPRDGTRAVKIILPEKIQIGEVVYNTPDQILLRPTGVERVFEVAVELSRLPSVTVIDDSNQSNPRDLLNDRAVWVSDSHAFLELDLFTVRAPRGFLLEATATDRYGNTHWLTPAVRPARYVELSSYYGWHFHVRVVPKQPPRITKR
jgi:hypothetical protein